MNHRFLEQLQELAEQGRTGQALPFWKSVRPVPRINSVAGEHTVLHEKTVESSVWPGGTHVRAALDGQLVALGDA
jgi:hypothetical protein